MTSSSLPVEMVGRFIELRDKRGAREPLSRYLQNVSCNFLIYHGMEREREERQFGCWREIRYVISAIAR